MDKLKVSWQDVEQGCRALAEQVKANGFAPDVILAVARGGLVPAVLLSQMLGVRELACAQFASYHGQKQGELKLLDFTSRDLRAKKVLVVDDVADSGATLAAVKTRLEGDGAAAVRIAVLHAKPSSRLRPDYVAKETDDWIEYPWEKSNAD